MKVGNVGGIRLIISRTLLRAYVRPHHEKYGRALLPTSLDIFLASERGKISIS